MTVSNAPSTYPAAVGCWPETGTIYGGPSCLPRAGVFDATAATGPVVIQGNDTFRLFRIPSGSSITATGITFQKGLVRSTPNRRLTD